MRWKYLLACCMVTTAAKAATDDTFLPPSARFSEAGQMQFRPHTDPRLALQWEEGTYNGQPYKIFRSGDIVVGPWTLRCRQDGMTDSRVCILVNEIIFIAVTEFGVGRVSVGVKHYPGTTVALRIDTDQPMTGPIKGWEDQEAEKVFARLLSARSIRTRYVEWPRQAPVDNQLDVAGLAEARALADWAIKARRP